MVLISDKDVSWLSGRRARLAQPMQHGEQPARRRIRALCAIRGHDDAGIQKSIFDFVVCMGGI